MPPPFSFDQQVSSATAKEDHIIVHFGEWRITGTIDEIDQFRERMGAPPEAVDTDTNDDEEETLNRRGERTTNDPFQDWGLLFCRPESWENNRTSMKLRKGKTKCEGIGHYPPLFSGIWHFPQYARNPTNNVRRVRTTLKLHINPTKYVRYQWRVPMPRADCPRWPDPIMFKGATTTDDFGEFSLDGKDNWLPTSVAWDAFANPVRWQRHLEAYLRGIPAIFQRELDWAHFNLFAEELPPERQQLNLNSVETYWEFSSDNPLAVVASLQPLMLSMSRRIRETRIYPHDLRELWDRNSLSLQIEIAAGVQLRIYAKTNRRIRFEVIHKLGQDHYRLEGGRTRNNWNALNDMIFSLRENAADIVNAALCHFRSERQIPASPISAFELLLEIVTYVKHAPTARLIATLLYLENSISASKVSKNVRDALGVLTSARILVSDRSKGVYRINPSRRQALAMLRLQAPIGALEARDRSRRRTEARDRFRRPEPRTGEARDRSRTGGA